MQRIPLNVGGRRSRFCTDVTVRCFAITAAGAIIKIGTVRIAAAEDVILHDFDLVVLVDLFGGGRRLGAISVAVGFEETFVAFDHKSHLKRFLAELQITPLFSRFGLRFGLGLPQVGDDQRKPDVVQISANRFPPDESGLTRLGGRRRRGNGIRRRRRRIQASREHFSSLFLLLFLDFRLSWWKRPFFRNVIFYFLRNFAPCLAQQRLFRLPSPRFSVWKYIRKLISKRPINPSIDQVDLNLLEALSLLKFLSFRDMLIDFQGVFREKVRKEIKIGCISLYGTTSDIVHKYVHVWDWSAEREKEIV